MNGNDDSELKAHETTAEVIGKVFDAVRSDVKDASPYQEAVLQSLKIIGAQLQILNQGTSAQLSLLMGLSGSSPTFEQSAKQQLAHEHRVLGLYRWMAELATQPVESDTSVSE